jgi:hypothetical protein
MEVGGFKMKPYLSGKTSGRLALAALLIILFFGLRPIDMKFYNPVSWLGGGGIRIDRYGNAMNRALKGFTVQDPADGFSIVFAARALSDSEAGFRSLLVLYGGSSETQLAVGQWQNSMVVMNGFNYQYINKTRAIVCQDALTTGELHFFAVTTSAKAGSILYMDGIEVARQNKLVLRMPEALSSLQLVVGTSIYGNLSWIGELFGLTIYADRLSPEAVSTCYAQWKRSHRFGCELQYKSLVSYAFNEGRGQRVHDQSGADNDLTIPEWPTAPEKRFFSLLWRSLKLKPSAITDIILNLLGFAPFSFFGFLYLVNTSRRKTLYNGFLVVAVCFILSFFIETVQAWMLSRTSSMLDLILNTIGGVGGVGVGWVFWVC